MRWRYDGQRRAGGARGWRGYRGSVPGDAGGRSDGARLFDGAVRWDDDRSAWGGLGAHVLNHAGRPFGGVGHRMGGSPGLAVSVVELDTRVPFLTSKERTALDRLAAAVGEAVADKLVLPTLDLAPEPAPI